jgi:NitT/TauT family transport system ATP-binding protein
MTVAQSPIASQTVAIAIRNLKKTFANRDASPRLVFENLSLDILRGNVVGFFGPSGCGKTTLLRILTGVLEFDGGQVLVFDRPVSEQVGG